MLRGYLILSAFITVFHLLNAQVFSLHQFSHKDGLTLSSVLTVYQKENGEIITGTDGAGILAFNGNQFYELRKKGDVSPDYHVTGITQLGDSLFFSTKYSGLFSYYNGKYTCIASSQKFQGELIGIVKHNQQLYIVSESGIYRRNTDNSILKIKSFSQTSGYTVIYSIFQTKTQTFLFTSKGNYAFTGEIVKSLNQVLGCTKKQAEKYRFVIRRNHNLIFTDDHIHNTCSLNEKTHKTVAISNYFQEFDHDSIIASAINKDRTKTCLLTGNGIMYMYTAGKLSKLEFNTNQQIEKGQRVYFDYNDNVWISSESTGLYMVSSEPFTPLKTFSFLSGKAIFSVYKTPEDLYVCSTNEPMTYIGKFKDPSAKIQQYPFIINAVTAHNEVIFLGTKSGIYRYFTESKQLQVLKNETVENQKITFLYTFKNNLFVGIASRGLFRIDLNHPENPGIKISSGNSQTDYFYTAQTAFDQSEIYFGTNNGIYTYQLKTTRLTRLNLINSVGSYIGTSTKDSYGNCWFTAEKGLIGILKNKEVKYIINPKIFPSFLFYTLNSDVYGNLIAGTNKGLNFITIDETGHVISFKWYDGKNGFSGYETNMRAQFQTDKEIYLGTVEGLYIVNPAVLHNLKNPEKPVIFRKSMPGDAHNTLSFQFVLFNPKVKDVLYSYRITGSTNQWNNWSNFSPQNQLFIDNFPNGNYQLEVRATYDGKTFSPISTCQFTVKHPFWKANWFVFVLIVIVLFANIYYISRKRAFNPLTLFDKETTSVVYKLTPQILIFGLIANTSALILGPVLEPEMKHFTLLPFVSGFLLIIIYLLSLSAQQGKKTELYKHYLLSGFSVLMITDLIGLYISGIHPLYLLAIILVNSIAPFIFEQIRTLAIYSFTLLIVSILIVFTIDFTIFSKYIFLIAILVSSILIILEAYLRFDSMEKYMFISGVVNQGNIYVVSFNKQGLISYVSENFTELLHMNFAEMVNQPIALLNNYIPNGETARNTDLVNDFSDGFKYIVPMQLNKKDIRWIEWTCKEFNNSIRVIIGQDVSSRVELENTYEQLVEKAEDLIYQCDVNGNFIFLNQKCFDKFGYSEDELIGRNSLDLIDSSYLKIVQNHYFEHFNSARESSYLEFPIITKKHQKIWIGQYVTTLFKPGTKKSIINGFLAVARDITLQREQQQLIIQQRDDITSSIHYAQRIQFNLLPNKKKFNLSFDEYSIIFEPRDIVSGDFYWMERIGNKTVFALSDCTGHGVPGSFMTLLGINLLNSIVKVNHLLEPGAILDELDIRLVEALPRKFGKEAVNDGMEITILVYDHELQKLNFACAGSRFLIHQNQEFNMYKGDSKHIGDKKTEGFLHYTSHELEIEPEATFYLFTDGFQDQFGGEKNKRYSFRRLLELFDSVIYLPLDEQEQHIRSEFKKWKSTDFQTDDVTIISLRFKNEIINPDV